MKVIERGHQQEGLAESLVLARARAEDSHLVGAAQAGDRDPSKGNSTSSTTGIGSKRPNVVPNRTPKATKRRADRRAAGRR